MGAHTFDELRAHVGHEINCTRYGTDKETLNVAIECETCHEVIVDYDCPEVVEAKEKEQGITPPTASGLRCPHCLSETFYEQEGFLEVVDGGGTIGVYRCLQGHEFAASPFIVDAEVDVGLRRSVFVVEVLTEGGDYSPGTLGEIDLDCDTGGASGQFNCIMQQSVSVEHMQRLLLAQGSDPDFLEPCDEEE